MKLKIGESKEKEGKSKGRHKCNGIYLLIKTDLLPIDINLNPYRKPDVNNLQRQRIGISEIKISFSKYSTQYTNHQDVLRDSDRALENITDDEKSKSSVYMTIFSKISAQDQRNSVTFQWR